MKTIMVLYIGEVPLVGEPNKGFFVEGLSVCDPLVAIDGDSQELQVSNEPLPAKNVLQTSGSVFLTTALAIGIMPGTSFVIWGIDDELAIPLLKGVEGFMIKELDYETFRNVLVKASKNADVKAAIVGEKVELAYFHYFGINIESLEPTDQIQLIARSESVAIVNAELFPHGYNGAFEFDRVFPSGDLESVLTAAATIEDLAKELNISQYEIVISLHTKDKDDQPRAIVIYENSRTRETDETSD